MNIQRRAFLAASALAPLARGARAARSGFPEHTVKLVVPYPAGGVVDVAARVAADGLAALWQQSVVVENRPGANGNLGAQAVKAAAADGHTLLVGSMFLALNPLLDRNARFTLDDFKPVGALASSPNVVVVPAASPLATLQDLMAAARRQPGRLNTPNPGNGSSNHLGLELLSQAAGVEFTAIPYKGQPPFIVDLVAGQLQFAYLTATLALPQIAAGKLRALAVAAPTRLKALPQVPTLAESGFAGIDVLPWNGVFAPAATAAAVVEEIASDLARVLLEPQAQRRHEALHAQLPSGQGSFAGFVRSEHQRWQRVVAERRIVLDNG
jgi:tripartite-type tricarboxylate transporter receptor subunit TctC